MNVEEYQAQLTALLYDDVRAAIPPMLSKLAGQSIFAFGLVCYDGPWIQSVTSCTREGLTRQTGKRSGTVCVEVLCAEWNYVGGDLSSSLKLSHEFSDKFYDGEVGGLDESLPWAEANLRFRQVFQQAGVQVLLRLRDESYLASPEFEADTFMAIHNPDPGRQAICTMIESSKVLNSGDWHDKFVSALPDLATVAHD